MPVGPFPELPSIGGRSETHTSTFRRSYIGRMRDRGAAAHWDGTISGFASEVSKPDARGTLRGLTSPPRTPRQGEASFQVKQISH